MGKTPYRAPGPVEPDLGELLSEHRFVLGGAARLLAALFIVGPIVLACIAKWEKDAGAMTYVAAALLFVGVPLFGVYVWIRARRRDRDVVRVHEAGLWYIHEGKEHFIAWPDVSSLLCEVKQVVRNGVPGPVTHRYTVTAETGTAVFTHGWEDVEDLADLLRQKTAEVIEPRVQEDLEAGRKVAFGPLSLSKKGLSYQGSTMPWKGLRARYEEGHVVITIPSGGAFCRVSIAQVPNAHVLRGLVGRMGGRV